MSNMLGRTGPFDTHTWKGRAYYYNMTAKRMNEDRAWRKEADEEDLVGPVEDPWHSPWADDASFDPWPDGE